MIKRKININQNNPNADYLDLLEIHQDRDFKNMSKKNLEEVYSKVLKNLDELKSRKDEMEVLYKKNAVLPGDDNFVFDVRV